jgi:hypothetical protein
VGGRGGCEKEYDKKTLRLRKREKRMKKRMNEKVPKALTKKVEKMQEIRR